jgi:hypothetical protein
VTDVHPYRDCRITPHDWPNHLFRDEVHGLCRAYGHDPNRVAWLVYDVIDAPLLRFAIYKLNEDGMRYHDPATGNAAMEFAEHLLAGELPAWWAPYEL